MELAGWLSALRVRGAVGPALSSAGHRALSPPSLPTASVAYPSFRPVKLLEILFLPFLLNVGKMSPHHKMCVRAPEHRLKNLHCMCVCLSPPHNSRTFCHSTPVTLLPPYSSGTFYQHSCYSLYLHRVIECSTSSSLLLPSPHNSGMFYQHACISSIALVLEHSTTFLLLLRPPHSSRTF